MKNSIKAVLSLAILTAAVSSSQATAIYTIGGPINNPANGHNYYMLSQGTWSAAETFAQSLGGHLATINDANENAWVYANVNFGDSTKNPWIGFNDSDENGVYTWISGEPVTYVNWAPGEPSHFWPHENYGLFMGSNYPEKWNNSINGDVLYGIAEVVPEPSSLNLGLVAALALFIRKNFRNSAGSAPCIN